ncbi:hypothetical protein ACIRPQ_33865 [Streptomyces sp. NPDC101213]|uniref:hypothetical protein n=1 Tax=Streptomyces sp. NPDC101213 TaxID=3366130 RepID=UPI003818932E
MCMRLAEVYETELSDEAEKHLAFVLAPAGSVEQRASKGGKAVAVKIAEKWVYQYRKGPALVTIKQLSKRVSMTFTQKATARAIPAGAGVVFSGSTNYVLTTVAGRVAIAVPAKDVKQERRIASGDAGSAAVRPHVIAGPRTPRWIRGGSRPSP